MNKIKKTLFIITILVFLSINGFAQVAINETGASPDPSTILDLQSTTKGFLVPRVTSAERNLIETTQSGLLVYDTDTESFWYYDSSQVGWVELGSDTNSGWAISGNNTYSSVSGNVGIGTTNPSSKLQIRNGNLSLISQNADAYIKLSSDEEEDITPAYIWSENAKGFAVGSTPGTPQLLVNAATGKVGIGTSNPNEILTIRNGNISAVSEGSDSFIYLGSDELGDAIGSYIWTDDNVGFSVGSTEGIPQLVIKNSNGNVGIGTTSPGTKLEIAGQIKITGGNPGAGKVLTSDVNGVSTWSSPTVYATSVNDLSDAEADAADLFLGDESGNNNNGLNFNTGIGIQTLKSNTTGTSNTATGMGALQFNSIGYENTSNGHLALQKNTTGNANAAFGKEALLNNTTKSNLTAIGYQSLYYNGTGSTLATEGVENTAAGSQSLYANTLGSQNSALGMEALKSNTTGSGNSAFGAYSLHSNTTGIQNTSTGAYALSNNTTADGNTAFGYKASYQVSNGNYNSSFGVNALYSTTSGTYNSAFSFGALFLNQTGDENTAYGYKALYSNLSGSDNTAIGSRAGYHALGSGNVFIGRYAGYNESGSNKLYIDNSNTATPLVYGDFSTNEIEINGTLAVDGAINTLTNVTADNDVSAGNDLTAGGDAVVTGDYTYASSKTKILKIPGASFGVFTNQDGDKLVFNNYGEWTLSSNDGNGAGTVQAGVTLPQGAIVTRFSIYHRNLEVVMHASLRKKVQTVLFDYITMASIDVSANSQWSILRSDDTSISNSSIDNNDNFYYIVVEITNFDDDADFGKFYGAEIEYTINKLE